MNKFITMNAKLSLLGIICFILRFVFEYYSMTELVTWANISATVLFIVGGLVVLIGLAKYEIDWCTEIIREVFKKIRKA